VATAIENGLEHFATVDREFRQIQTPRLWLVRE